MRLACRLREVRGDRSLTQISELAGISRGQLSELERGIRLPETGQVDALEQAYGVELADWYAWRGPFLVVDLDGQARALQSGAEA